MRYAIIKSHRTELLKVVDLHEWDSYDWDGLYIIRSIENDKIVWFETEDEAEIFMLSNFNERMIEPVYMEIKDNTGKYFLG